MRKFLLSLLFVLLLSSSSYADEGLKIGFLSYLGTTEGEFQESFDNFREFASKSALDRNQDFINSVIQYRRLIKFYPTIMSLLMSFRAGKISEIMLPEAVGTYLLRSSGEYEVKFSTNLISSSLSFGFRNDNVELKEEFDRVIAEMRNDGTLSKLEKKYISGSSTRGYESVKFEKFVNAPVIKVGVTGDMPPIDMFAGDGMPTGYNTAVLSEIGRRLKRNISITNVESGGRSAALFSGRADVIFWYRSSQSNIEGDDPLDHIFQDVSDGVILSIPYYSWENEVIIGLKTKTIF